MEIGQRGN
jgi:Aldehyde dehydrogenase family